MKEEEKELFFELSRFMTVQPAKLEALLPESATPAVLGHLFYNRMQAIAYGTLSNSQLLDLTNREFRNSLQGAYWQNMEKNKSYYTCLDTLGAVLKPCLGKYAMLKGALLGKVYPDGYRTCNDVDLLVRPADVTDVGEVLSSDGFQQGYIRGGQFFPATRQEIISSKMMRGETVPYVKEVNYPFLKHLEVDINYSLDFKNSAPQQVDSMLCRIGEVTIDDTKLITLDRSDFFIHLCGHLYKEATALPWVEMKRDMSFYKFVDIYRLLQDLTPADLNALYTRAKELGMDDVCSCAILWTDSLLPVDNDAALNQAHQCLAGKEQLLDTVVAPKDHKDYVYAEHNLKSRFFSADRTKLLKEAPI